MTDDEKTAVAWLDQFTATEGWAYQVRTLKRMLARPVMPEEPTPEIVETLTRWWNRDGYGWLAREEFAIGTYRALRDHITAPKTKEVEVESWGVFGADGYFVCAQRTKADAESWIWRCAEGAKVVRLTGKTTVPA